MKEDTVQKLSAYSTIKSMIDSKKYQNQYFVLAEFIKYLIVSYKCYSFSVADIIQKLKKEFDFEIPYEVVKSSLKKIPSLKRKLDEYTVVSMNAIGGEFERINGESKKEGECLIYSLKRFCLESSVNLECFSQVESDFIKFILDKDDVNELKYGDLIGRFCISVENDKVLQKSIEKIREGSVLYCGLCYNISEIGSVTSDIVFYLDTEIIFFLAGYDGNLSKKIADDFIELVRKANKSKKRISLVYFREVRDEIDRYFGAAKSIVMGQGGVIISRAMKSIVNGCTSESDVIDKQTDLYYKLEKCYGIVLDTRADSYYSPENHQFNIETDDLLNNDDPKVAEAIRYISHINVLRKGQEYTDYLGSKHVVITETHRLLSLSDEIKPQGRIGYAISIARITNILWMKLGGSLGKARFPYNADIAVKARTVLDKSISASVNRNYARIVAQYKDGSLSEELAIARLLRLREKIIETDIISNSNIDDLMDFSEESLRKYEETIKFNEKEIEERDEIISMMKSLQKEKNHELDCLQKEKNDKDKIIKEKDDIIREYEIREKQEKNEEARKQANRNKFFIVVTFINCAVECILILSFISVESIITQVIQGIAGIIGFYGSICTLYPKANIIPRLMRGNTVNRCGGRSRYYIKNTNLIVVNIIVFLITIICYLYLYVPNDSIFDICVDYIWSFTK